MNPTSHYLNIYLGSSLKARWIAFCARANVKPGAALKDAIEAQLAKVAADSLGKPDSKKQQPESPDTARKSRLELRLTQSERDAIAEFAEADGCSAQRWVINALRAILTRRPQIGMTEWKDLGESNYQMLAIGRNLNQIARHLNEQGKGGQIVIDEKSLSEVIEALRKTIKQHTMKVDAAMRANVERWRIL